MKKVKVNPGSLHCRTMRDFYFEHKLNDKVAAECGNVVVGGLNLKLQNYFRTTIMESWMIDSHKRVGFVHIKLIHTVGGRDLYLSAFLLLEGNSFTMTPIKGFPKYKLLMVI